MKKACKNGDRKANTKPSETFQHNSHDQEEIAHLFYEEEEDDDDDDDDNEEPLDLTSDSVVGKLILAAINAAHEDILYASAEYVMALCKAVEESVDRRIGGLGTLVPTGTPDRSFPSACAQVIEANWDLLVKATITDIDKYEEKQRAMTMRPRKMKAPHPSKKAFKKSKPKKCA